MKGRDEHVEAQQLAAQCAKQASNRTDDSRSYPAANPSEADPGDEHVDTVGEGDNENIVRSDN